MKKGAAWKAAARAEAKAAAGVVAAREAELAAAVRRRGTGAAVDQCRSELRVARKVHTAKKHAAEREVYVDGGADGAARGGVDEVASVGRPSRSRARGGVRVLPLRHRRIAEAYADLAGRLSSPMAPGEEGGGGISDGGAVMRVRLAERMAAVRELIGGACIVPGSARHADRRTGVPVLALVDLVCVDGFSLDQVLGRYGWSRATRYRSALRRELIAALSRIGHVVEWG